jgi:hypothetical protein
VAQAVSSPFTREAVKSESSESEAVSISDSEVRAGLETEFDIDLSGLFPTFAQLGCHGAELGLQIRHNFPQLVNFGGMTDLESFQGVDVKPLGGIPAIPTPTSSNTLTLAGPQGW